MALRRALWVLAHPVAKCWTALLPKKIRGRPIAPANPLRSLAQLLHDGKPLADLVNQPAGC
ncbi:hypothetical protein AWC15_18070 [Mycobacterium lacus]|nr:hypothetical protein AWC15_18070 [Mycobacterium lacus]